MKNKPNAIILIGMPGSGKSTFSKHLVKYVPNTIHLNQDILGRQGLLSSVHKFCKSNNMVIIDRCNPKNKDRLEWSSFFKKPIWCVHFDFVLEDCCQRVENRKDHPNLKGKGGINIVKSIHKNMEPVDSTIFNKYFRVTCDEDINDLLAKWKLPPIVIDTFFKFPRTRHIWNLGSTTRDDLLMSGKEVSFFLNKKVYIEEKIDGANLGISMDGYNIKIQNRSHYVNNKSHKQFSKLEKWKNDHSFELYDILADGNILFGEWVAYKHSIHYTQLPDLFVAFDLYSTKEKKFYSRSYLETLLKDTTIPLIRCISESSINKVDDLIKLTQTKSVYYDGPVEGIVVKVCNNDYTEQRGKIVRSDFICGNEHWAKGNLIKNEINN